MGLMTATGPLSRHPAGTFNFQPPPPGRALYFETSPKRVRVIAGGETIADSRAALLLQESGAQPVYYFPSADVRADVLEPSDAQTHCPKKGDASYHTIRVGDAVLESAAWYYPQPLPGAEPLAGHIAFYFERMERWLEEDEEIVGHPRDPYHRIDTRHSRRHVRVLRDGEVLADSRRAVALFESNLPVRWYLPREDVSAPLTPSDTHTICPYKGRASYYSVGSEPDLVWYYPEPLAEAAAIRDMLCFYDEKLSLEVDG